jgi:WhiB family redox-sensing transcriptional regulator
MTGFNTDKAALPRTVDREWHKDAACSVTAGDWFPGGTGHQRKSKVIEVRKICRLQCPVRAECARYALNTGRTCGVWGGVDLGDTAGHAQTPRQADALRAAIREA